jgi:SAM-dependent methyltransferase
MPEDTQMKLYNELAWVWNALTPIDAYKEEAERLQSIAVEVSGRSITSVLELGCGGGYLASHLSPSIEVVLVDNSSVMLAESIKRNPNHKHILGDMISVDCQQKFDLIIVHDAIMYVPNRVDMLRLLQNICRHMHTETVVCILPDVLKDNFSERVLQAVGQDEDRCVVLSEWHWDPDLSDDSISVEFSLLIREDGIVSTTHESHIMTVLSVEDWFGLFHSTNLKSVIPNNNWDFGGEFFCLVARN